MSKKHRNIFLGSKATFVGIIIIIFMSFIAKTTVPIDNKVLPRQIVFSGCEYFYQKTIEASPFFFIKAKEGSSEGFRVLIMRKDKKIEAPEQIYIYVGKRRYMKYSRIK